MQNTYLCYDRQKIRSNTLIILLSLNLLVVFLISYIINDNKPIYYLFITLLAFNIIILFVLLLTPVYKEVKINISSSSISYSVKYPIARIYGYSKTTQFNKNNISSITRKEIKIPNLILFFVSLYDLLVSIIALKFIKSTDLLVIILLVLLTLISLVFMYLSLTLLSVHKKRVLVYFSFNPRIPIRYQQPPVMISASCSDFYDNVFKLLGSTLNEVMDD